MSLMGLGRVKTPTRNLRVEIPSRFRRLENQKYLRALLREDDRENNSAHSWFARVFTQPGSKAVILKVGNDFRSSPNNGHVATASGCPFRAMKRHRGLGLYERGRQLRRPYLRGRFSSFDRAARNSASACLPANCAAVSDWYPSPVILMPNGLLLRRISQLQRSGGPTRRPPAI